MKKIIFHICLAASSAVLLPRIALGETPPQGREFLYIASFRPVDSVLTSGFDPPGIIPDLFDHYARAYIRSGRYPNPGPDTQFIDVYPDERSAVRALAGSAIMANARATHPASNMFVGNVYRIRANENFYSAGASFGDLLQRMRATNEYPFTTIAVEYLERMTRMSQQFVTRRPVTGHMIDSYIRFTVDYARFGLSTISLGPTRAFSDNYAPPDPNSRANLNPYPIPLPYLDLPLFRPEPPAGPDPSSSSNSSSSFSFTDSEEGAAADHDGDRFIVADPGGLVEGLLSVDGRVCPPGGGSHMMKRSADSTPCSTQPLVNLSRRARVLRILLAQDAFLSGSSSDANGHDEL